MSLPRRPFYRLMVTLASLVLVLAASGGNRHSRTNEPLCFPQYAAVTALALSPDSALLAIGDTQGDLRLQPVDDKLLCRFLRGHEGPIERITFHPSGTFLATLSQDGTVRLWNTASGTELPCALPCSHEPRCLSFTADGRWLAIGYEDGSVWTWDHDAARPGPVFRVGERAVLGLAFAPDRSLMAVLAGGSNAISVWDTSMRTKRFELLAEGHQPQSVTFTSDGREIVSVESDEAAILRWDAASGQLAGQIPRAALPAHESNAIPFPSMAKASCRASANDGKLIAWVGADQVVRVWRRPDLALIPSVPRVPGAPGLAVSEARGNPYSYLHGSDLPGLQRHDPAGPRCARSTGTRCP